MNWKQFLKPNRRKIVIWVILFLITTYLILGLSYVFCANLFGPCTETMLLIQYPCGICIEEIGIIDILVGTVMALIIPSLFLFRLFQPSEFSAILMFIFNAPYQYLLSCLIVWIYDKFRKKNKK